MSVIIMHVVSETLEVVELLSDEVFQNEDNKSEASSYVSSVSEERIPVVGGKRASSKSTTIGNG